MSAMLASSGLYSDLSDIVPSSRVVCNRELILYCAIECPCKCFHLARALRMACHRQCVYDPGEEER